MNLSRRHRLRALEDRSPDPDPVVSARDQFEFAEQLFRIYGDPSKKPAPKLTDFRPRLRSELDNEFETVLARVYSKPKEEPQCES